MTNEAVAVKKERSERSKTRTLSTGVRVAIKPVPLGVLQDALGRVKPPKVPVWHNPDKDRDEENPSDPDYILAVSEYAREQSRVTFDVFVLYGLDLVDEIPDGWDGKLKLLERLGDINLGTFDLTDPIDREFVYKRYCAVGAADRDLVQTVWGVPEEDVARAAGFFPGDEEGGAD